MTVQLALGFMPHIPTHSFLSGFQTLPGNAMKAHIVMPVKVIKMEIEAPIEISVFSLDWVFVLLSR